MEMTEEMFEVLIGKYLDGEITPSEQRLLEAKLDRDPAAAGLLEEFQNLHQLSCEVVTSELLEKGKSPDEIFQKALKKSKHIRHRIIRMTGRRRFALGAAAGLIIGIGLHFILPMLKQTPNQAPVPNPKYDFVKKIDSRMLLDETPDRMLSSEEVNRNVDWYNFTDQQGNQWLIEGLRENRVRPVGYEQGL